MRTIAIVGAVLLSATLQTNVALAKSPSLIGSWSGGGTLQPRSGAKERTRCRATIHKAPAKGRYRATYSCSSPLGLATQSVSVKKISATRFRGSFYNAQHKVRGSISITLHGNRQSVSMRSNQGRGWITMRRR